MTCRHGPNDPNCGSYRTPEDRLRSTMVEADKLRLEIGLPDNSDYEILEIRQFAVATVLRVRYESCVNCSYEGTKILVYRNVSALEMMNWKQIDPHFRDGSFGARCAPSPIARFPASAEGMLDALAFAAAYRKPGVLDAH